MKRVRYLLGFIAIVGAFVISDRVAGAGAQGEVPRLDGAISGRVILPDGSPAAGVRIMAIADPEAAAKPDAPTDARVDARVDAPENAPDAAPNDDRDQKRPIPGNSTLIGLSRTDDEGRYQLERIPQGRYLLAVGTLEEPVYYPGVKLRSEAVVVAVTSGAKIEDRDFKLNVPLTLKVSGRVIRDGHQAGSTVLLNGVNPFGLSVAIAPDGSFEFPDVRPGTYRLSVAPNLNAPAPTRVVVDAKDVTGLEIPIPQTAISVMPVTFQLAAPAGAPLPKLTLTFVPMPSAGQRSATISISSPVHEQKMDVGTYRLSGPNVILLPAGYFVRSMMAGSTDLMKAPLIVTRSGVPPVTITFGVPSPPWVKVTGKVTGLDKAPVRATKIRINLPGFIAPLTATVTEEGMFELPFVRPGRHRVELEPAADAFSRVILVGDAGLADARIPMFVTGVKVSGRVEGLPPAPAQTRILAWLRPEPVATGLQSFSTVIGSNGTFIFSEVPPGRYQLAVACEEARGFRTSNPICPPIIASRMVVPVAGKDISNLVLSENVITQREKPSPAPR